MTPQDLQNAATQLTAKAAQLESRNTGDDLRDRLAKEAAKQLHDRANQVRLWASRAARTGEVTPDMESGADEFLRYAGV